MLSVKRLTEKKIWIDLEEPKAPIMFAQMIQWFQNEGAQLLITARDFDSTYKILDDLQIPYTAVGKHGGDTIEGKMQAYIERLQGLFDVVVPFKPDFFVTFGSVEGPRLSMGLGIPSIGFSDEPRSYFVSKQLFPFIDKVITPKCIPLKDYLNIYAHPDKFIRYNGIDEIAWLSHYIPNPKVLEKFNLKRGQFVLIRSEPAFADYFLNKLKPEETLMVGDSLDKDIKGAKNIGMKTCLAKYGEMDLKVDKRIQADYTIKSIDELLKIDTLLHLN